ncbi:MAG: type 4a pilus biogenesis protein PilO [Candidatus Omnitrophica bacterium]|nr:type 4a pilus biogenesis protein PilO [Candidatus Omnitrophota bacterium]
MAEKPSRRVVAGLAILAALIAWVYYAYVVQPMAQGITRLREELRRARIQASAIEQAIAHVPELQQEQAALADDVARLRGALPSERELASVIQFISDLASQTNVKIQSVFPQRSSDEEAASGRPSPASSVGLLYQEIPIQIDAVAGFHQFGSFLSRAEHGPHVLRVRSLRISGNPREPRRQTIKLVMMTYVTPGAPVGAAAPEPRAVP